MAVRSRSAGAGVLALLLLAFAFAPRLWAGNYEYNFNAQPYDWTVFNTGSFTTPISGTSPPAPWEWSGGSSKNEGGWHTRTGPDGAGPGTVLQSPCFIADGVGQDFVQLDMDHRFNFASTTGTSMLALGQAQYRINAGSWVGVPLQAFLDANTGTSGNVLPTYASPLPAPPFDSSRLAWEGTTLDFTDTKKHQKSAFRFYVSGSNATLGVGDEIEFRFLMGPQLPSDPPYDINWEINSVNIKGVTLCPEPGALALAGIGGLGCLLLARRRRRLQAAQAVAVGIVIAAVVAAPARAESTSWNFKLNNGGWIASGTWGPFPPEADYQWKWVTSSTVSGGTSPHWAVRAQGVSPSIPSASFLTSPTFSTLVSTTAGPVPAQAVRISLAHDFFLLAGTTNGIPTTLGQLQYRLNPVNGNGNGTWSSLPLSAFTNGGSVLVDNPVFGPSPFKSGSGTLQLVDQTAFVAPNYLTPNGGGALPYVTPTSAAFTGASPGWPTAYVPSQAFLTGTALVPAVGISSMQLRLTNLNLAANCSPTDGWNVRFVQVDYLGDDTPIPPVPEPGALALGATGLAALLAAGALRRRHQRPSRPSESP